MRNFHPPRANKSLCSVKLILRGFGANLDKFLDKWVIWLLMQYSPLPVAKPAKPTSGPLKEKIANVPEVPGSFADPEKFIEEILEKTSHVVLSEVSMNL